MEGRECMGKLSLLVCAEEVDVVDFVMWHRGVWFASISAGNRRNGREIGNKAARACFSKVKMARSSRVRRLGECNSARLGR